MDSPMVLIYSVQVGGLLEVWGRQRRVNYPG